MERQIKPSDLVIHFLNVGLLEILTASRQRLNLDAVDEMGKKAQIQVTIN